MKKLFAIALVCGYFTSLVYGEWPKKIPNAAQIYIEVPGTEVRFAVPCNGTGDAAGANIKHKGKEQKLMVACGQVSGFSATGSSD